MSHRNPYDVRAKYTCFRILVIGRASAGKTTILQRVCNTTEDPCIYDENNKNLLEPTSSGSSRVNKHDIHRSFAFRSNPGFIFHDSPGFESGDTRQLQEVLSFIEEKAKSIEVDDQLHAIWFCFVLNNARPLSPLETMFFETARAGKVPVIAIFTKFDDLITQIYDIDYDDDFNRQNAKEQVETRFRKPLYGYKFPPQADVCFEDLHISESSKHQDQVKVLIEKTAASLDDTALKMLFVSVQQNNIELSVQYAIDELFNKIGDISTEDITWRTLLWFGHSSLPGYNYGKENYIRIIDENGGTHVQEERVYYYYYREQVLRNARALGAFLHANFISNDSSSSSTRSNLMQESYLLIFTALLICMENTFWNVSGENNFMELFKKSFTLYVESGTRKKMKAAINGLRNERGGWTVTRDFKAKFTQIIIEHYLSQKKSEKMFSRLQRLIQKIHGGQRI